MNAEIQLSEGNVSGGLQIRSMDDLSRVSKMLSQSGFFSDAKDAAQCGVKVLAGVELGFGAFASMTGIHIIKGKPSLGAGLMASAVKRHPNYNYRVLEHTEQACRIEFYEKWDGKLQPVGTSEMTMKDAIAAKLHQEWDKQSNQWKDKHNWKTYPKNMLFARAMSNGVKWYCPDVFDAPVYTPEELGAPVDGEGNYIDAEVREVPAVAETSPYINAAQLKRYMAIAGEHKWSQAAQKGLLFGMGITSRKQIPVDVYDEVIASLESLDPATFEPVVEAVPVAAEVA